MPCKFRSKVYDSFYTGNVIEEMNRDASRGNQVDGFDEDGNAQVD